MLGHHRKNHVNGRRRPQTLLSRLIFCGCCGGPYHPLGTSARTTTATTLLEQPHQSAGRTGKPGSQQSDSRDPLRLLIRSRSDAVMEDLPGAVHPIQEIPFRNSGSPTEKFRPVRASVKRLFRICLLLQKAEQTQHRNEGGFGGQVTSELR